MSKSILIQRLLSDLLLHETAYQASRNHNLVDDHENDANRTHEMFQHREAYANDELTDDEENRNQRQKMMYRAVARKGLLTKRNPLKHPCDFAGIDTTGDELSHIRKKPRTSETSVSHLPSLRLGPDEAEYARAVVDQRSGALIHTKQQMISNMSKDTIADIIRAPQPAQLPLSRAYAEEYCLRTSNDDEPSCLNGTQCVGNLLMDRQAAPCTLVALILPHERSNTPETWRNQSRQCLLCYRNNAQCFWAKYLFSAECAPPKPRLPSSKRFLPFHEKVDEEGEYSVLEALSDTRERVFGYTKPVMQFKLSQYNVCVIEGGKKVIKQHLLQYPLTEPLFDTVF